MKFSKGLHCFFIFCILSTLVQAQLYNSNSSVNENLLHADKGITTRVEKGDVHIRWYPLGLINFSDLNLTLGAEYSYSTNKSLVLDAGYIMASVYESENGNLEPVNGWLVKTTHRWYIGRKHRETFLDAEAWYKSVRYQDQDLWVGRGVVNGVPAYEELMTVSSKKDVFTLGARMGKRIPFSPSSPVGLELWWGLGIRYRHYYPNLPGDAQVTVTRNWIFDPFNYDESWLPDFQMGLRLTFRVRNAKHL